MELDYPTDINPNTPSFISDIVIKLGAKAPDMRYQSASGLLHDLKLCDQHLKNFKLKNGISNTWLENEDLHKALKDFHIELGSNDLSGNLDLYQEIVGREFEYDSLVESYMKIDNGESNQELCIITGPFGGGKSSLVHMLHHHISTHNHFFGKWKHVLILTVK